MLTKKDQLQLQDLFDELEQSIAKAVDLQWQIRLRVGQLAKELCELQPTEHQAHGAGRTLEDVLISARIQRRKVLA